MAKGEMGLQVLVLGLDLGLYRILRLALAQVLLPRHRGEARP